MSRAVAETENATTRMCNWTSGDAPYPCNVISVSCNTAPCDDAYSDWSNCSDTCGYGERTRTHVSGDVQTMFCNLISCDPVDCPNGAADIVFVVDKSSSITDYGFEIYKQLVSDVVSMLPAGGNVRVAMVSFSVQASTVFEFTNSPSASDILGDQFTGGFGVVAYALQSVTDLFGSSVNVPKIAVFLTDGQQMLLEACANELSQQLQQSGVEMFAVGIGSTVTRKLYPFMSIPSKERHFRAGFNSTAMKLANAILNVTCGQSNLLTIVDDDQNIWNPNMANVMHTESAGMMCTDWSDWTPCSESCGATGHSSKSQTCTDENGEIITTYTFDTCFVACTPPPTLPSEPDCTRCDYTKGQIWLPDSQNCHDYYICEKVDTWLGRWYWTYHHVSCGLLYWDQSRLTCTPIIQPGCQDQVPEVVVQPDLSGGRDRQIVGRGAERTVRRARRGTPASGHEGRETTLAANRCTISRWCKRRSEMPYSTAFPFRHVKSAVKYKGSCLS
ncbi:hypothetical protein LSAT2_013572 [Lamellibrachia satsuma]|nr:hypothetical protein LSAT2_013572 [Lamellibrachia satsuma]